ncbi:Gx transporter family protein [Treponema sp. OMZ 840]|uniref:Gx transporter family protein n=1 Tax=Treponema sp. OMZ 840 TaxID=244313 RepID=UPI003D936259
MDIQNTAPVDRHNLIAFFASLCLFLSAIEYVIPKPLPFMRLGLANMPILLGLYIFNRKETALLVLFKVLGQGFITGTLFSYIFLFSAAGSFASAFVMLILHRTGKKRIGTVGISLGGALANTAAQILLSHFILFGNAVRYIAPVLLISGFVTGLALGFITGAFAAQSKWFALLPKNAYAQNL